MNAFISIKTHPPLGFLNKVKHFVIHILFERQHIRNYCFGKIPELFEANRMTDAKIVRTINRRILIWNLQLLLAYISGQISYL